ncbi:MAG: serine hydrolase [Pseudomonadota bacterium]
MLRRCVLGILVGSLAIQAQADNGAVAQAAQLKNITIDGKLGDWPEGLTVYPVQMNNSREVVEADADFAAGFRAGYDPKANRVYVALEITDDVHVVAEDAEPGQWDRNDSVIVYIDFNHTTTGSGSALYLTQGEQRAMLSDASSWDADVANAGWDTADVAVARDGNVTTYEFQFASPTALDAHTVLGLDLLIADQDVAGDDTTASLVSWGPGFGKSQAGGRTADLLLLGRKTKLGTLAGHIEVASDDPEDKADPLRVRVQSKKNPKLWVQTVSDESGAFSVSVPVGTYTVTSVDRLNWIGSTPTVIAPAEPVTVKVAANKTTTAPDLSLVPVAAPITLPEQGALFGFERSDAEAFDDVVETLMTHFDIPGASIALVKDGQLVHHQTYGSQNAYSELPVDDDTLFEAASITKAVFAFTVNRMAERGEIDLDRPLHTYLPFDDIAHDKRYEKITARHALSHQTGFPNWRWQNDDGQIDLKFYPGIQYGYSGEGFEYLGRVVAHIKGEPLEDIVRRETLAVMGFQKNTYFAENPALYEQASRGHWAGMTGPHGFPGEIGVAHSMYTEAGTFSNFLVGLLAEKGLSAEGYEKMLEPQVATPTDEGERPGWPGRYGLGFHMMNSPYGLAYGHGGNNGNFTCQFEIYPEQQFGFAIFTNADTGWLMVDALREYLVIGQPADTEAVAQRQ